MIRRYKWVKAANAWAVIEVEFDKKTNKTKQTISWHYERPELEEASDD